MLGLPLEALIPLAVAGASFVTSIIAIIVALPKQRAETRHAEAEASADLVSGFNHLVSMQQREYDKLLTEKAESDRRATLVPILTRRVEELEAELKRAHQVNAALRGKVVHET